MLPATASAPHDRAARLNRQLDAYSHAVQRDLYRRRATLRAASCPIAERIIGLNPSQFRGIPGLFHDIETPAFFKRHAAETIVQLRRNRLACKQLGRNWRGADAIYLRIIRHNIAEAARLTRAAKEQL